MATITDCGECGGMYKDATNKIMMITMATIILKFDLLIDCLVFPFFVLRTPVKTASLVSGDARCCQSNFHQKFQSLH